MLDEITESSQMRTAMRRSTPLPHQKEQDMLMRFFVAQEFRIKKLHTRSMVRPTPPTSSAPDRRFSRAMLRMGVVVAIGSLFGVI